MDNLEVIKWWVDASYNVHIEQTGSMMTLAKGSMISKSSKGKLNMRSSVEGELVWVDDALP